MCELLGLSASAPVELKLSFAHLAAHGTAGRSPDGWGIAFLDGNDAQTWRDPHAAATSPWVACLAAHPISSRLAIAHIRHATRGGVGLANTQPFMRELFGRMHVFAHNGTLSGVEKISGSARFQTLGETDSERAFCGLIERISALPDDPERLRDEFVASAGHLRTLGPANLLYASGRQLLVHADRRIQENGHIAPPGLWVLERHCVLQPDTTPAVGIEVRGPALKVALVASVPLTAEAWRPLERGTVLQLADGEIVAEVRLD